MCYLNIIKEHDSEEEETREIVDDNSENSDITEELKQSALKVIEDIDRKNIFDDIKIDFDNILANLAPEEDQSKLNQMLINYYEEIHDVLQKRLDECQDIIEEYMTHLIETKKKDLQMQMERYAMGEDDQISPAIISDSTKNDISGITVDHNNKLKMLREQYDEFLRSAENEFFNVLRMIKTDPGSVSNARKRQSPEFGNNTEQLRVDSELQKVANDFINKQKNLRSQELESISNAMQQDQNTVFKNALKTNNSSNNKPQNPNKAKQCVKFKSKNIKNHGYSPSVFDFNEFKENQNEISEHESFVDYNNIAKENVFKEIDSNNEFADVEQSIKEMYDSQNDTQVDHYNDAEYVDYSTIGKLLLWGSGKDGRLGNSTDKNCNTPNELSSELTFQQIHCGYHHTAAISDNGTLLTWGRGVFGQLGHGNVQSYSIPNPVSALIKVPICQVSCGWQHTMALSKSKQAVFSWGYGEDGQLGHDNNNDCLVPKQIEAFTGKTIDIIDCGHSHSGAISNGDVYTWGCNTDSRLIIETSENVQVPRLTLMSELKKEDTESFYAMKISLGVSHTAIITRSGELFTAGSKLDGQLGAQINDSTFSHNAHESDASLS